LGFGIPTKMVAAVFALCAFTVAIVAGMATGNPSEAVLTNALICLVLCHVLGLFVGAVGERALAETVAAHKAANPIPGGESASRGFVRDLSGAERPETKRANR
jgi:hypothetical protein